jgi:HEAT repeat protein
MALPVCGCHFSKLKLPVSNVPDNAMEKRLYAVLAESVADEDPLIRCHGLESLAYLGTLQVAPLIRKGLHDTVPAVRFSAAVAAGDIKDHPSRGLLEKMLNDENVSVKLAAGYALERLGDNRFGKWYDNILLSGDEKLSGQVCMLLGKLGNTSLRSDSNEKLWQLIHRKNIDPVIRLQAAEALAGLGDKEIIKDLLSFAGSGYADDRIIAISGLEKLNIPESYAMLTVLTEDDRVEVQLAALRGLGSQVQDERMEVARQAAENTGKDNSAEGALRVRQLALLALGSFAAPKDGYLLYQGMGDKSKYIRVTAARATIDYLRKKKL